MLIGVLVVGLVLTRRRLGEAEAELDRVRAQASAAGGGASEAASAEPQATRVGVTAETGEESAEDATGASDISSEWEQAVPPMDS